MNIKVSTFHSWSLSGIDIHFIDNIMRFSFYSHSPDNAEKVIKKKIKTDTYRNRITISPTVENIKDMVIIEGNLLPFTNKSLTSDRLVIENIIFSNFYKDRITATVIGKADHNTLPMKENKLLDFQIHFCISDNLAEMILAFIENNIGKCEWV